VLFSLMPPIIRPRPAIRKHEPFMLWRSVILAACPAPGPYAVQRPAVNQRELFDVVVRTIGLLVLLRGLWWTFHSVMAAIKVTPGPPEGASWKTYIRHGIAYAVLGGLLMAYAEGISRLFYR